MDGLFTDELCTGAVICELLLQLVLKTSDGGKRLQLQRFLQFIPVIGSRELEEEAAKGRIGLGVTSEICLQERVLRVGAAIVTSELR